MGLPSIGTHLDAANLDRLNIDGPLHFQTGVLCETLQAFSWSGLRALRRRASGTIHYLAPEVLLHTDAQTEVSIAEMIWGVQVESNPERLTDLAARFTSA